MPDLLLELFSEEMPANSQRPASEELKKHIIDGFVNESITYSEALNFSTPQRLCIFIEGLASLSEKKVELKRGPRIDAPSRAVEGFASSVNLSVDDLKIEDGDKGKYYFAECHSLVSKVEDLASKIIEESILKVSWQKSMRWGCGKIKWIRPLRSILCIMTYDEHYEIIPINIDGIKSCDQTWGHRFISPEKIKVNSFETYNNKLRENYVILNPNERAETISVDAGNVAFSHGLRVIEDKDLLNEISGLVEYPSILIGQIDSKYQDLPLEVLQTSMKVHQKFFSLINDKNNRIEKFITVANILSKDNGKTIINGNQKVLDARLSDAKFFFENDLRIMKDGGSAWSKNLNNVIFHRKLGSLSERVRRINKIALQLAPYFNLSKNKINKAVGLLKIDLCSQMVQEFPELQGVMGKYYAEAVGHNDEISSAILEHYQPVGPNDSIPTKPLSIVVALADKIELLCCFWSINEKPSGSKDPFALRRAAIGLIRLILSSRVNLDLKKILNDEVVNNVVPKDELILFLHERLRVLLRDKGIRYDVIEACLSKQGSSDLVILEEKITALGSFLTSENGFNLLSGFKRANNILSAEEKKDGVRFELDPRLKFMNNPYEKNLFSITKEIKPKIEKAIKNKDFITVMSKISDLQMPIDEFFKEVKVNDDSQIIRRNRLCLLNSIKNICCSLGDLTLIQDINSRSDN